MGARPHVVIATRIYAPEPAAAAMRHAALARALSDAGARVTVLTTRAEGNHDDGPVRVRRWPVLRDSQGAVRGYLPYLSYDIPLFFRLLTVRRPDVIVAEPPPTTGAVVRVAAAIRHVPYIYYAADLVSIAARHAGHPGLAVRLAERLERFALSGARLVLTVAEVVADKIVQFGTDPRRVAMIGNGVDTAIFSLSEGSPRQDLLYAGTMGEVHGADIFVRAFARIAQRFPAARLVFVGQGPQADLIESLAHDLLPAGSYQFTAPVAPHEIARLLGQARAGLASVVPGSGYEMALATKALATAATGTPTIFTGGGVTAQVVHEGQLGWAVDYTPEAVAAAMEDALATLPSQAERRRRAAWVDAHASLRSVAATAARIVLTRPRRAARPHR